LNKYLRRLPSPFQPLRSQKGVALLIAMFAFTLLSFVAMEVAYDTAVDNVVASQQINRIKAHYAAKAGIEISLLRIMLYKQAVAAFGDQLGGNVSMLDPIWNFPFMWPPTAMATEKMTTVDKDMMASSVKESLMEGSYSTTIMPEGGKMDINDLGSDVKALRDAMKAQVLRVFTSELEHNDDFRDKYSSTRFEELVNNIADYIDEDSEGQNTGDESAMYSDLDDKEIKLPPNRPLRTVDELHQIAGMTDAFYNLLAPQITVFGTKGINVNYADKDLLMSIDATMNEEAVNKVIERRSNPKLGGFFKSDEDFFTFLDQYRVDTRRLKESKIPFIYGIEFNFRVISTGLSSNVRNEITAVTYDYDNLAVRLAKLLNEQDESNNNANNGSTNTGTNTGANNTGNKGDPKQDQQLKIKAAKGRPQVVYWEEN
jgi:general secretion pathway protein K